MKILLINMPIRMTSPPNLIPTGLAIIHQVLTNHNFEVELWDLNTERPSNIQEQLKEKLDDVNMVCFSGLITTYQYQKRVAKWVKKLRPEVPVISGGGCASSIPALMLSNTKIDCAVVGEGEDIIFEVISDYCNDKMKKQYIAGELKFKLSEYPWPNWDALNMKTYLSNPIWDETAGNLSTARGIEQKRSINIIASRGCPFSCNFCWKEFTGYNTREPQDVVDEIIKLKEMYDVDFVAIIDDNMMVNVEWLTNFCNLITPIEIFWGCHGRVDSAKYEVLSMMSKAGCRYIGFGMESGSQEQLDRMNKKTKIGEAVRAIWDCREADIYPNCTYIFGYPGETEKTLRETSAFMRETQTQNSMFFCVPYPKTKLWNEVYKEGRVTSKWDVFSLEDFVLRLGDATEFVINLTEWPWDKAIELKEACERGEL